MRKIITVFPWARKLPPTNLVARLPPFKLWLLSLCVSVVLAEVIVVMMEVLLKGAVTYDYLLTGLVASLLVSALVAAMLVYFLHQQNQAKDLIAKNQRQLNEAQRIASIGSWELNLLSHELQCSPEIFHIFGITPCESGVSYETFLALIHPEDGDGVNQAYIQSVRERAPYVVEHRLCMPNGLIKYVIVRGETLYGSNGRPQHSIGTVQDITQGKVSEHEMKRLNRALRMRSACNECLTHISDEKQLLIDICRLAVDIGGYSMAWVGYAMDDDYRTIFPAAHSDAGMDYLTGIKISWSADKPEGCGPAGQTIRSGQPVVSEDLMRDPRFSSWRASAQQHGFGSVTSLPLRDKSRIFGVLVLYSGEVRQMPSDEIILLQEMADDLAFGIVNIRAQEEQRRLQSAVVKVAAGVSAGTGKEFFEQLAKNMAEALGAAAGFVVRLLPGEPHMARTIAAVVDGEAIENFEYLLGGIPHEGLTPDGDFLVLTAAAERLSGFPLIHLKPEAYVGRRLLNSSGDAIGLLFVLFREPLKEADFILTTLKIFAARAAAELERQDTDALIREQASLLDKAQDAIVVRSMDHRILFWNKSAERLYGWTAQEVLGNSMVELIYEDVMYFREATHQVLALGEWSGEITQRRKNGTSLTAECRWTLVRDEKGQPLSILAISTDITRRKMAENEIQLLAFYDHLTKLPNRQLLLNRLGKALVVSSRTHHPGALLFMGLDNFKTLNETLGYDMGDILLQQVAQRLAEHVRQSDTVARLGGDEFVVMLNELDPLEAAAQTKNVGEKILDAFIRPFQLTDYEYHCSLSIGVTLFNDQLVSADEVLKRADLAMYQAKASGKNTMRFFDPELQLAINARAELEADLRRGLQLKQFILYYQPQVDFDGKMTGVEALLRWQHPNRGLVSPLEFIPIAEKIGLIVPLGHWVLETACAQLADWAARPEMAHLSLAVNVSARQFRHPEFVYQVLDVLQQTGADPLKLKLELTESLLLDNVEDTIAKMGALKAKGVGFSLDDFGTGYSSLSYLKRLPLDQLKIDKSFVKDVLTNPNDAVIARTIITLAHSLGLAVIAEGVETEAQRQFLASHGCHAYQGYLVSKPLPLDQIESFMLSDWNGRRLKAHTEGVLIRKEQA
ncbi:MAG: EAL domain-containing protein [Methylophilaceae bacterium]